MKTETTACFIKARAKGEKRFAFLAPDCSETSRRIYAALIPTREAAEEKAARLRELNPGVEFRVVPA